jgi:predicted DNA-binding transcriptional regulator AlpA
MPRLRGPLLLECIAMRIDIACEFLTSSQVRARYGHVSHMWLFRKMRDAGFPAPVRFGGNSRRYWKREDLEKWERKTLAREAAA